MYSQGPTIEAQEPVIEQTKKKEFEALIAFIDEEFLLYDFKA